MPSICPAWHRTCGGFTQRVVAVTEHMVAVTLTATYGVAITEHVGADPCKASPLHSQLHVILPKEAYLVHCTACIVLVWSIAFLGLLYCQERLCRVELQQLSIANICS